jgi:hypothetical protein
MAMAFGHAAKAQTNFSVMSSADTFLATGSPGNPAGTNLTGQNFGAAGVLFVAPPTSVKGEFQSVARFDLSAASNAFNAAYGSNNWSVTGISLTLAGNYGGAGEQPMNMMFPPISGGNFVIEWLSNNNWAEGTGTPIMTTSDGVTYDSLPTLLSGTDVILSTNTYTPPGDNVPVTYPLPLDTNVVAEITSGDECTFRFYAADDQIGYLFNSYNYGRGNQPLMNVTAKALPPRILGGMFTNGGFQLSGQAIPNSPCRILAVSNSMQTNWQALGTVTADVWGLFQFSDTNTAGQGQRFYRLAD